MADISIAGADVLKSSAAQAVSCIWGETIVQGDVVYLNSSDSKMYKSDTDDNTKKSVTGVALTAGAAGQPGFYTPEDPDLVIGAHGVALGGIIVLSGTAGKMAPAADLASGDYTTVLGVAKTATTIAFKPVSAGVAVPA
jgi:hypothetical protein